MSPEIPNSNLHEVHEVEDQLRKGLVILSDVGAQLKRTFDERPAALLAGVAVLGFLTGLALRRPSKAELRGNFNKEIES